MTLTTIKDQAKTEKENEREREILRAKRRDLWRWSTREQKKREDKKKKHRNDVEIKEMY